MKFGHFLDPLWEEKSYESNGLKLNYALYNQEQQNKDYLLFLPGRGEFVEKFNDLPKRLHLKPTTTLVLVDHRGQGSSEGYPYHIDSYDEYCEDLKALIDQLEAETYSFFACSMGGLITLYGIQKNYFNPRNIFLVSPLISLPETKLWFITRYFLLSIIYYLGFGKKRLRRYSFGENFESNLLTNNKKHFDALKKNPRPPQDGTVAWIRATFRAILAINLDRNIKKSPNNLTICIARHEMVVCNQAIYRWIKQHIKLKDKSFINLHFFNTKHEILFDLKEETDRLFSIWHLTEKSL